MHNCILILCILVGAHGAHVNHQTSKSSKNSGVIVNPLYDQKNDVQKHYTNPNEIRPPTHQQLIETYNLRNIINNAVQSDTYAVGGSDESMKIRPKKLLFPWFSHLMKLKLSSTTNSSSDENAGTKIANRPNIEAKPTQLENVSSENKFNLLDSPIVSGLDKKPFSFTPKSIQREQLQLISIEENLTFPHGQNIRSWITIQSKTSNKHALVGISQNSMVLIVERNGAYEIVEELDFKTTIRCFTNYLHWNDTSKSVIGLVIVEINNQLIFVSTRDDFSGISIIWQWTIHSALHSLVYFSNEGSDNVLMINAPSSEGNEISADIYKFDLHFRRTWLIQKIPLKEQCKSVAVINTYRELVLAFAHNNTVELYKSDRYATSQFFKFHLTIQAYNVKMVTGFQMGGFSYLAVTGLEPKIFRYFHGSFAPQTILSRSWGLVELIFPIPARTYRDDLILLVQHRIKIGTHSVSVVEALIWNSEAFDVSLSIPCKIGADITNFGLTCLLDYDRDAGIDGLSIIQNGNSISLIVPRIDAPSTLFRFQFELKSHENPEFFEMKDFELASKDTEMIRNYQNEILSNGKNALIRGLTNNGSRNDVSASWQLSTVTSDSLLQYDGAVWDVDEIYFGNKKWTKNDYNLDLPNLMSVLQELKSNVDNLEKEFVDNNVLEIGPNSPINTLGSYQSNGIFNMKKARVIKNERRIRRNGQMYVNELQAKHINTEYINDIRLDDLVFAKANVLDSIKSLIIENDVAVHRDVKLISNQQEIVGNSIDYRQLKDDSVAAKNIQVNADLDINSINGVLWKDFVQQVVMKNLPNLLTELRVKGNIIVKENIEMNYLNEIPFPKDYLWMHKSDFSIITGEKIFRQKLSANDIDTNGAVDGIYAQETISLVEVEHIRGLTTFAQLEVTESLDVNGTINGKHLNEFKPNPSLLEVNKIPSDCLFQNLQVHGPIYILNKCNEFVIDDILFDVVYKSNPRTTITSFKSFENIESVVELKSNLINGVLVHKFMTLDTIQDVNFDQLIGNVMFTELKTNGLFDFINVTELDRNSIKLTGEQFTEAEVIFESNVELNFDADIVEIQRSFNGLELNDLIRIDESLEIDSNLIINSALVNDLQISGQIIGNEVVDEIVLSEFDASRLSRTRSQDITSIYHIENVAIENGIDAIYVNSLNIDNLRMNINRVKNVPGFLTSAEVRLNNLIIDGDILVNNVNGHDFNSIKDNACWLNQPNIINADLEFLDKFEIAQRFTVNNVNNQVFENFIVGLVSKVDENIEFKGRKIFQNEFHIVQGVTATSINGISTRNIWIKNSTYETRGQMNIIGNFLVKSLTLEGYLHSVYWRFIEAKYSFNFDRQAHVLTNNVKFISPTIIQDLQIYHGLNNVLNITEFLSMILLKSHDGIIGGKKHFESNVIFLNDLRVAYLDTVHIPTLFDNIVINEVNENIVISGNVAFEYDLVVPVIHVSGDVLTSNVMDCSLYEWNGNALRTNLPEKVFENLVFPIRTLRATDIELRFLNGNSMATVITLNSQQSFGTHLLLSDVFFLNNIDVGGSVNGENMKHLLDNSVMVTGDHHITAPTAFQSARVLNVLQTINTVNGKNLNNIATLHDDLFIYSPLSCRSIKARSLNTKDTISGLYFDYWYDSSLWKSEREVQIVSGTWIVNEGIFHSAINGQNSLNGILVKDLANQISSHQSNVWNSLEAFNQIYIENCRKMVNLIQKTQSVPYFLTHFEESFSLRVQNVINSVHFLEVNGKSYLVINVGCVTVIYIWNRNTKAYERICETETGNADSWLDILNESNEIHLVSNTGVERSNCPTSGLNLWKFDGSSLVHVSKIAGENKFAFLHSSKIHPQRFLALTNDNKAVNEFDLHNNLVEQWHLPTNGEQFRFVPENANLGVALSNGKQLSSLSSIKLIPITDNRKERSTNFFSEAIGENVDLKRSLRCPLFEQKLQNVTVNCKLWQQAQLKALSNIGPFRNLEPATENRLIKDFKMASNKLGSSPLKLTSFSSERIPDTGSNLVSLSEEVLNATARDAFGDIESKTIDIADSIIDNLIELETNSEDIDFDDSLIGSSSNESKSAINLLKPLKSSKINEIQPLLSRDMFGNIQEKTIKVVDKVKNTLVDMKKHAKENQAKFQHWFHAKSDDDGRMKNKEQIPDEKKPESKNMPKIPQVNYKISLAATPSKADSDVKLSSQDYVTKEPTTVPHTDELTITTTSTSVQDSTVTNFAQYEVREEEPSQHESTVTNIAHKSENDDRMKNKEQVPDEKKPESIDISKIPQVNYDNSLVSAPSKADSDVKLWTQDYVTKEPTTVPHTDELTITNSSTSVQEATVTNFAQYEVGEEEPSQHESTVTNIAHKSENHDRMKNKEQIPDEKKPKSKNISKIPQVNYNNSLAATPSKGDSDVKLYSQDYVTKEPTTVPHTDELTITTTNTSVQESTVTNFAQHEPTVTNIANKFENDDRVKNKEQVLDEKKPESKNISKILQVNYNNSFAATPSKADSDVKLSPQDYVTKVPTTVPHTDELTIITTSTSFQESTVTNFAQDEIGEEEPSQHESTVMNIDHKSEKDDRMKNKEQISDEKKPESKNISKIPQVNYNNTLAVTPSKADSDVKVPPKDYVTKEPSTVPHTDGLIITKTSTPAQESTVTNFAEDEDGEEELKISKEISSEGIATAENFNFPTHPAEEIVAVTVGKNGKHLVAVSSLTDHVIQGKHDLIRIYEDIIEGNLFQTLICHRPRCLTVLNMRDETILAFIEHDADVQIYVYRGIQGFVKFTSFELPSFVMKLTAIHLPVGDTIACSKFFLAAIMKKEIRFIEAKSCGYCGVNAHMRCD